MTASSEGRKDETLHDESTSKRWLAVKRVELWIETEKRVKWRRL